VPLSRGKLKKRKVGHREGVVQKGGKPLEKRGERGKGPGGGRRCPNHIEFFKNPKPKEYSPRGDEEGGGKRVTRKFWTVYNENDRKKTVFRGKKKEGGLSQRKYSLGGGGGKKAGTGRLTGLRVGN